MIDFEHNYKPDSSINYDLVDACHQLLQQCYALMEAIAAWIDFLNNPEEQHSPYGDIYPTQELLEGLSRLGISAKKEAQFLEGLLRNGNIQPFHLNGSNLPYLEAVYRCARQENGLVTIFKTVKYIVPVESFDDNKEVVQKYKVEKYRVDVISCHGEKWIKVSARNVRWLYSQDFMVDATIPNDAMENDPVPLELKSKVMLLAASQNQTHFKIPKICFQFSCFNEQLDFGRRPALIPTSLFRRLNELGVSVEEISPLVSNEISRSINWRYDPSKAATSTLNLDITTLLALASQLTHNGQASELNLESQRKANNSIKVQLQQEKDRPIMPLLAHYLFGRTLTTTQSCYDKFISIVNTLAGPLEALRARILFRTYHNDTLLFQHDLEGRADDPFKKWKCLVGTSSAPDIQVLPDSPSPTFLALASDCSLRAFADIHISMFGSGHHRKLTTVTANVGVARCIINASASHDHLDFPDGDYFLFHEPRSLAENKLIQANSG